MEKVKATVTIESTTSSALSSQLSSPGIGKAISNLYQPRVLKCSEYKAAAACLAEAFGEDDVAQYFIETDDRSHWTKEQKWDLHVQILEYVTYAHCLKGLALAVGPNYDSVALWCVDSDMMAIRNLLFHLGIGF